MALNFPDSPTNGQKYTDATTGETWTYEASTNSWTSDGLTTAVGIQYKGGLNITVAPPAGVSAGWQYTVTTGGTANAGFTGLSGNVPAGSTVIYDGANWQIAGAGVLWVRTGTELSPSNAGDAIFTSGALKVGGTTAAPAVTIDPGATTSPLVRDPSGNVKIGPSGAEVLVLGADGRVRTALGTAALPAITPVGDPSTGIYSPGAGQVAISTNSIGRLFVNASGRVGIATTSPDELLHLGTLPSNIKLSSRVFLGATHAQAGAVLGYMAKADTTNTVQDQIIQAGTGGNGAAALQLSQGSARFFTNSSATDGAVFNTERLRITSDGKLLHGGTLPASPAVSLDPGAPTAPLVRDSSGRLLVGTNSSRIVYSGNANTKLLVETSEDDMDTCLALVHNQNTGANALLRAPIVSLSRTRGTLNGSNTIVQSGDALGYITFEGADGTNTERAAEIKAEVDGTPAANSVPGRLTFSTTPTGSASPVERMRIESAGRTKFFGDTTGITVGCGAAAGASVLGIALTHSAPNIGGGGTVSFRVTTNGDVQNTNNSYAAISDIKLKENIVDAKSQWDDIKALRVVNYNFKPKTGAETHKQLGLIAQEVEKVCPGLVGETKDKETIEVPVLDADGKPVLDEDGKPQVSYEERETGEVTKNVNYSILYMKAVGALQEAMTRIEQLEAKVTALEAK